MGDYVSEEESLAQSIEKMGERLGGIYHELSKKLAFAHLCWNDYRALFASPETIDLLNSTAPAFFWTLEQMMWEATILHLCRLTDRPRIAGHDTLTLRCLPSFISDVSLTRKVQSLVDAAVAKAKFARDWRDRRVAHTELPPTDKQTAQPLAAASRQHVEDALEAMRAVLNCILWRYQQMTYGYEYFEGGPGGVQSMLAYLRKGLDSRNQHFSRFQLVYLRKPKEEVREHLAKPTLGGRNREPKGVQYTLDQYNRFQDLFSQLADQTVECSGKSVEVVAAEVKSIVQAIGEKHVDNSAC